MELVDFLLSRIAEDEAAAPDLHRGNCDRAPVKGGSCACGWPERLKAKSEAERKIIDAHSGPERARGAYESESRYWDPICKVNMPCQTLRLLAEPHADHQDYDESWAVDLAERR